MIFIFLLSFLFSFSRARFLSCYKFRPSIFVDLNNTGGSNLIPPSFHQSCEASAKDISDRISFPQYTDCLSLDTWGPQPNNYPLVPIPYECDVTLWMQTRVLSVVDYIVSLDLNYCHHHTPGWLAIDSPVFRKLINGSSGICVDRGPNARNQWLGIDCSSYTSFVYNFGLGAHLQKAIGQQACGSTAPGRVLPINNATLKLNQGLFQPGDLLYISNGEKVSHVIMWTGYKLTNGTGKFGLDNIIRCYANDVKASIYISAASRLKKNETLYIITDSSVNGPNYRIFTGWYVKGFSHARRLINPDSSWPKDCPTPSLIKLFGGQI